MRSNQFTEEAGQFKKKPLAAFHSRTRFRIGRLPRASDKKTPDSILAGLHPIASAPSPLLTADLHCSPMLCAAFPPPRCWRLSTAPCCSPLLSACPLLPAALRSSPLSPAATPTPRHSPLVSAAFRSSPLLPAAAHYSPLLLVASLCSWLFPTAARCSPLLSAAPRCSRLLPIASCCSPLLPLALRCLHFRRFCTFEN